MKRVCYNETRLRRTQRATGRRAEEERNPIIKRYLATEILFKGYCIIFLMRFSSSPFLPFQHQQFIQKVNFLRNVFPLNTLCERRLAKLCRLLRSLSLHSAVSSARYTFDTKKNDEDIKAFRKKSRILLPGKRACRNRINFVSRANPRPGERRIAHI